MALTVNSVLEASRIHAQEMESVQTAWMGVVCVPALRAFVVPTASSAPTRTDMDLSVTKIVHASMASVITESTATGPARKVHVRPASQGDSVTSRPLPVGPMCSFVTSMPPASTAMGQRAVFAKQDTKGMESSVQKWTLAWN